MAYSEKQIAFEANKLTRILAVRGSDYSFKKDAVDKFGEPTGGSVNVDTIRGLYHDAFGGYVTETIGEGSRTVKKYQPMILMLLADASVLDNSCYVSINGVRYDVKSIKDIGNMGYGADVSLEPVM